MAPLPVTPISRWESLDVASQIRAQWTDPSDIMSLLLLVGADVIQTALAQQTGGANWPPPPVVFTFGWVAYSFCGILAAVGDKSFLPTPELRAVVMSSEWGYQRVNNSWIISRLLRDYEELWMPEKVKERLRNMLAEAGGRSRAGLCVAVFEASADAVAGVPARDSLWYSGYAVATLQLAIAAIPWVVYGIWQEFAVAAFGTALAFITASLPHWTHERWPCSKNVNKSFILTRGNGAQHAIIIIGAGRGLDLEELASSSSALPTRMTTSIVYSAIALLWCILLVTVCGIKNQTWFLLAIGAIGMMHTIIVAGAPRQPGLYGIHLKYRAVFAQPKVMRTLQELEQAYPGCGRCMLKTFFPGDLHEEERVWWQVAREQERSMKKGVPSSVKDKAPTPKVNDSSDCSILANSETSQTTLGGISATNQDSVKDERMNGNI